MSIEIQQSLFEESNRIEIIQRQAQFRKEAFRAAFDFLEKHDPPVNTEEFWMQFCKDLSAVSKEHKNNELCQKLLIAVAIYLGETQRVINDAHLA